jgi:hypothetical protein
MFAKSGRLVLASFFLSWACGALAVGLNVFEQELTRLARSRIVEIATADIVVEAVRAQNRVTAGYDQAAIEEMDRVWSAAPVPGGSSLVDTVMARPLSRFLAEMQAASNGLFTEIIVMDAKGLNVGLSRVTTDYWQGDEDKWLKTVPVGPGALHIGPLHEDESTRTVQSQVSIPIVDPQTGAVIGALTVGIDVEET